MGDGRALVLPPSGEAPALENGSVLFVGTATVLLRYGGFTILTDPNFLHRGEKVHLGFGLTSTRLTEPALELEALPRLGLILLSHMHEDHFDRTVEAKLDRSIPIVTNDHAARALKRKGFADVHALEAWERLEVRKGTASVDVTAMPGRHGPGLV